MSVAVAAIVGLGVTACTSSNNSDKKSSSSSSGGSSSCKVASGASNVVALPGYQVCLFVGATTNANHPDNVVFDGTHVWIGWQNITSKVGMDNKSSTLGEYTTSGKLVKSWAIGGGTASGTGCHTDGMRWNATTRTMWVMCNEDGSPRLFVINPSSSTPTQYSLPNPTPWGGGFDDIQFVNGVAYADASNPTLNAAGKNIYTALYKVTLSGTKANLSPVLKASAKATTLNPPIGPVTLNLTDPDSMMIDPQGDLVLDSQGDMELLFIHGVGTPSQTVKVLPVGTPVDDTVWPTSTNGCMIIADNASGVYKVCSNLWVTGTPLTTAPNDSTIISFVGALNLGTGQITPVIIGMGNPHGMAFVPQ